MSCTAAAVAEVAMPHVEHLGVNEFGGGAYGFAVWFPPRQISLSLALIHHVTFDQSVEAIIGRADNGIVTATDNAGIEETMLVQNLATGCPSQEIGRASCRERV